MRHNHTNNNIQILQLLIIIIIIIFDMMCFIIEKKTNVGRQKGALLIEHCDNNHYSLITYCEVLFFF